ncbi:MAG: hypothetical protein WCP77_09200 [Roseococcus sp.]|jgi:hypothetical protein
MNALLEVLLQLLASGVLALGGYAITRLSDWLKLKEDSEVRVYLNQALERGVDLALAEARGRLPGYARLAHPEVSTAVERAAEYARDTVPDALARFRIDGEGLRDMVSARLATRPGIQAPATAAGA